MTVLRVTVPDQYFCTKHTDLNITAREKKSKAGTGVPAYGEIFTSALALCAFDIHKLRFCSADVAAAAAGLHKIMQLQDSK